MSQINNNPTAAPVVDIESRIAAQTKSSLTPIVATGVATPAQSFEQALRAAGKGITLSGHAQTRLASRQIELTDSDLTKLSAAMDKAAKKGARSSLVLMDKPGQADGQRRAGRLHPEPHRDYRRGHPSPAGKHLHQHRQRHDRVAPAELSVLTRRHPLSSRTATAAVQPRAEVDRAAQPVRTLARKGSPDPCCKPCTTASPPSPPPRKT